MLRFSIDYPNRDISIPVLGGQFLRISFELRNDRSDPEVTCFDRMYGKDWRLVA